LPPLPVRAHWFSRCFLDAFDQKYGFLALADAPFHLFLPMKTIEALFAG
jgi:hypothetical protein